jgi:hypothetical protein
MEPTAQVLATDTELGPKAFRRRSRQPGAFTPVSFRFLESDYATFVAWWKTTLKYGHKWFWIELPSAGGITWHVARFAERYKATLDGHRYWNVTARLELRERQFSINDRTSQYDFLEDFENGFAAYTSVSGNTSIFTVREGMTSNCMHCAPQSSGTIAKIRRELAAPVTADFLSFRFRVTAANSDDGAILGLFSGTNARLYFNPIREGAFDGARRPKILLWNGVAITEYNANTSQVVINRVYRVDIQFIGTPGATVFTMFDETTGSEVYTFSPPLNIAPVTFDRIEFTMDSGVTTSETDYDDIYALSYA